MSVFSKVFSEISMKYVLNGIVGATVWSDYKRSKFIDALRQIFIGGIVAGYTTPIIADKLSLPFVGFLSFTVGMCGMITVDIIYTWVAKKIKLLF